MCPKSLLGARIYRKVLSLGNTRVFLYCITDGIHVNIHVKNTTQISVVGMGRFDDLAAAAQLFACRQFIVFTWCTSDYT